MKIVDEQGHAAEMKGDVQRALEIWRNSGRDGNEYSTFSLCVFHMVDTTPQMHRNYKEGFDSCSKMALKGYTGAQHILGRMYYNGLGVEKDDTNAFYWFTRAAEGGDGDSQYIIGLYYLAGRELRRIMFLRING